MVYYSEAEDQMKKFFAGIVISVLVVLLSTGCGKVEISYDDPKTGASVVRDVTVKEGGTAESAAEDIVSSLSEEDSKSDAPDETETVVLDETEVSDDNEAALEVQTVDVREELADIVSETNNENADAAEVGSGSSDTAVEETEARPDNTETEAYSEAVSDEDNEAMTEDSEEAEDSSEQSEETKKDENSKASPGILYKLIRLPW